MATSRIFEYIETYYNRQRKHSAIGHTIPMQFEKAA
jgi:transposase InsO family protein